MGGSNTEVIGDNAITPRSTAGRGCVRTLFSYALGVGCLVWVFHTYDFSDLLRRVAAMKPYWLLAAILCDVLSYVCQGLRWRLLLRPFGSISVMRSTQAIYAGLFVNEMLPMKLGELVRVFLVSRWMSIKLGSVGASFWSTFIDGVWLAMGISLTIFLVPLRVTWSKPATCSGLVSSWSFASSRCCLQRTRRFAKRRPTDRGGCL